MKLTEKYIKISNAMMKIAQAFEASEAMRDFINYQAVTWGLSSEVMGKVSHKIAPADASMHLDVQVTMDLAVKTPENKAKVEDKDSGFAKFLMDKFKNIASEPKWKDLAGYTATFTMVVT